MSNQEASFEKSRTHCERRVWLFPTCYGLLLVAPAAYFAIGSGEDTNDLATCAALAVGAPLVGFMGVRTAKASRSPVWWFALLWASVIAVTLVGCAEVVVAQSAVPPALMGLAFAAYYASVALLTYLLGLGGIYVKSLVLEKRQRIVSLQEVLSLTASVAVVGTIARALPSALDPMVLSSLVVSMSLAAWLGFGLVERTSLETRVLAVVMIFALAVWPAFLFGPYALLIFSPIIATHAFLVAGWHRWWRAYFDTRPVEAELIDDGTS